MSFLNKDKCNLSVNTTDIICTLIIFIVVNAASAQERQDTSGQFTPPAQEIQSINNPETATGNARADRNEAPDNNQVQSSQQEQDKQDRQTKKQKPRQAPMVTPEAPAPARMDRPELLPSLQRSDETVTNSETATNQTHDTTAIDIRLPAGLLSQPELDLLAARLNSNGTRKYRIYTGTGQQFDPVSHQQGLLLMRDPDYLQHLGGNYYHDGRGNLILFGLNAGETDNKQTYAMTLFSGGGHQLVVDTDGDNIVDVGVSEGLEDRFGFLTTPGMQHARECLQEQINAGDSPTRALPNCLSEDSSGGGNSGGGASAGDQLDSAIEPDCGSDQPIAPGGLTQDVVGEFWSGGSTRDGENHTVLLENSDTGERTKADVVGWVGNDKNTRTLKIEDSETGEDLGTVKRNADGSKDHNPPPEPDMEFSLEEADDIETDDESQAGSGGKKQPGPGPGGIQGSGSGNDPRCREPSTWNRLATEECANNMTDCLKRMHDVIYAATGGRCETGTGPADGTQIQCKSNDSAGDCFAEGGSTTECLEEHAGDGNSGAAPGENDDLFNDSRGNVGYGLMDVHPFGATLAAMCRKGGGAGPCGDPTPTGAAAANPR